LLYRSNREMRHGESGFELKRAAAKGSRSRRNAEAGYETTGVNYGTLYPFLGVVGVATIVAVSAAFAALDRYQFLAKGIPDVRREKPAAASETTASVLRPESEPDTPRTYTPKNYTPKYRDFVLASSASSAGRQ
jgi:hypothetical protein